MQVRQSEIKMPWVWGREQWVTANRETRSPDKACRGWRMANDSTRSSAMSDVL